MQLPNDLLILALPSTPGSRRWVSFSGIMALGMTRVSP